MKDYYIVLGVSRTAKFTEIRKAYRKKALQLHPDANKSPSAKEEFLLVSEAYDVLKNVSSRARYDRLFQNDAANKRNEPPNHFDRTKGRSRSMSYSKKAEAGRQRGEKDSKKDEKSFKREKEWSGIFDIVGFFGDIISIFT